MGRPPRRDHRPPETRAAYYAARPGGWRDWWTLLHPPYTAWHLSYVVVGACLAPVVNATRLIATLLAFFCAVGLAAHALDELHGRPLRTRIPGPVLAAVATVGLLGAVGLGVAGAVEVGWALVPFLVLGPVLVIGYNAELFGGAIHNDIGFAASWGAFPVLTAYVAQTGKLALAAALAAVGAFALSAAQRTLSTPARMLRRRTDEVTGTVTRSDGTTEDVTRAFLLAPLERALRAMSWAVVLTAAALAVARLDLGGPSGTFDATTEAGHRHLHHPVVAPLQDRSAEPGRGPHDRLVDLDGPGHVDQGPGTVVSDPEPGLAGEVASDGGVDGVGTVAPAERHRQPHAVREWRSDHTPEHGALRQPVPVESELGEPRPPALELVDLLQPRPELLGSQPEGVLPPVGEHGSGHVPTVGRGPLHPGGVGTQSGSGSKNWRWSASRPMAKTVHSWSSPLGPVGRRMPSISGSRR